MAILLLSRTPSHITPFHELLDYKNEELLLLASSEELDTYDLNKYAYVKGFNDFDINQNVELEAVRLAEKFNIREVVVTSEFDIIRSAKIREILNIKGQGVLSAIAFRDKIKMKEYAMSVVDVPSFSDISSPLDIGAFINRHGFPVVIKPRCGAGSVDTFIINDMDELTLLMDQGFIDSQYQIEEYIQGQMYTIDGLFYNGEILCSWPGRYLNSCLSFHEGKQASNVQLSQDHSLYDRLQQFIKSLITSMPMPKITSFHAEVFHTSDDRLVLCEVASRTGGGAINEVSACSFGISLNHMWIKGQCGLLDPIRLEREDKIFGWVQIPPKKGTLKFIPTEVPFSWTVNYQVRTKLGTTYDSIQNSGHKIAVAVVYGNSEEEAIGRMEEVTQWIEKKCIWG